LIVTLPRATAGNRETPTRNRGKYYPARLEFLARGRAPRIVATAFDRIADLVVVGIAAVVLIV
jgi:hypothetical protein